MVMNLVNMVSIVCQNKPVKINCEYSQELPREMIGDPFRVHRILQNLLDNAVKFTHEGNVTIKVNLKSRMNEKILVQFCIQDTGIGIPFDKFDDIFEQFTRLNPTASGVYKGMGLGLHIVKQFVEELGGEIKVSSQLNEGSTFEVLLDFNLV